jgi:hypothetical protein
MIDWFDKHQGFSLVMLTAVYVIATVIIAFVMTRANQLARKNIEVALQLEHRRSRPYLVFDIEARGLNVFAVLRNIGQSAALDITIQIEPKIMAEGTKKECSLTRSKILCFAPGREVTDLIDVRPKAEKQYGDFVFTGNVSYQDTAGRQYTEPFRIQPSFQFDIPVLQNMEQHEKSRELSNIARALENIARKFPIT